MSDPISDHSQELIAGYALRSLAPDEMQRVAAMIAEDPQLQALLDDYQSVMAAMAEPTPGKAPTGLKSRILDSIDQRSLASRVAQQSIAKTRRPQSSAWILPWRINGYGLALGGLLMGLLGLDNYHLRQQMRQLRSDYQAKSAEVEEVPEYYAFKLQSNDNAAQGLAALDFEDGQIQVSFHALSQLEEGESYHLWAFTENHQEILCGQFRPSEAGTVLDTLTVNVKDYPAKILYMRVSRDPDVVPLDLSRRVFVLTSEI
jgi:anti-sigma-K factor RskA